MQSNHSESDGSEQQESEKAAVPSSHSSVPQDEQPVGAAGEEGDGSESPDEKALLARMLRTTVTQQMSGPLPPPNMLHEYEALLPGMAERLVSLAEKEQMHRHHTVDKAIGLERHQLTEAAKESLRGQLFAFLISMTAIFGGIWLIANDKPAGGVTAIISSLGALVTVFLANRYLQFRTIADSPSKTDGKKGEGKS